MAFSLVHIAITIIIIAGILGVLFVITRQMGIAIPPWVVSIFWIIVAVFVGVLAIKFIAGLA